MKPPLEILQPNIKIALASGEAANALPIPQLDSDKLIAGGDALTGPEQRLSNLVDGPFASYLRYIRTNRLSLAVNHMAGGAFAFTEEELLSGRGIAGYGVFSSRRIQRVYQGGKGIQFLGGQIEWRHACPCNPVVDQVAQLLNGPGPH